MSDDREGDPFDRLDSDDREGDVGDTTEESSDGPHDDGGDAWFGDAPPGEAATPEPSAGSTSAPPAGGADGGEDPFPPGDDREGDPFEDATSAFERMDVGDVDPDSVWESLDEARMRGSVSERQGRTYAEVSKHRFCEQCEYLSDPPSIECAHEGTEIVEFLDMETVRVVDCPVVAERRDLEDGE